MQGKENYNYIAKSNSSIGMKYLLDLVIIATNTNIILIGAPHRYDLIETSCVNQETVNFNCKLRKKVERLEKIEMIDVESDRTLYKTHGLHLNPRGKESMANKTALKVKCMKAKRGERISAKWYLNNQTPETPTPAM
jgi:hypothetical protein